MILNTRRNTSPRLAATWLTFMASAAALFAVTAICLAPRIVLAQGEAAPAAANTQGSLIDDPRTPAVASAALSFSPAAGEAASGDAAPSATPKPAAIGSGPKLKTGHSAVNSQPAVVPAPPTPEVPAAPVALEAPSAPRMPQGSFVLSAAATPEPEPKPGRKPRPTRAETEDSALEERLERLEKMVESLMARQDAPQNPYHVSQSADTDGPIDRKEIAKIEAYAKHQAEIARKQMLDGAKEIEKIKEQAKHEAARAADQAKGAAVDAQRVARAEQKRQTSRNFKEGSKTQLDDLRKQLEILDREREKLERQIEQLERNQEQLDEQRDEDQDNDAQSDTSEVNPDSIQTPRQ